MCVVAAAAGTAVAGSVAGAATTSLLGGGSSGASSAANAADPFASQRGQYQQALAALMANPSSIESTPGYQANLQSGLNAVQGSAAAQGMLNSGNVLSALQTYGQNYEQSQLTNQELLLAQLAGANIGSPGTAGQILQSQNSLNQSSASALGSAVGNATSSGLSSYFGGSYSSGSNPFATDTSGYGAGANTYGFSSGVSDGSYGVTFSGY
jgi:hypothetical protein